MAIEDRFSSPDDLLQVLAPLDEDGRRCMYQQIPFPFQLLRRPVASTGSFGRRCMDQQIPFPFQLPRRPAASTGSLGRRWRTQRKPPLTRSLIMHVLLFCRAGRLNGAASLVVVLIQYHLAQNLRFDKGAPWHSSYSGPAR